MEKARWHYGLVRRATPRLHVELDGKEVWTQTARQGVVGYGPTDPYCAV